MIGLGKIVARLTFASIVIPVMVGVPPVLAMTRAQEPSPTAAIVLSAITAAQAKATEDGSSADETAAAIAIAIDRALPDDLTPAQVKAVLDEVIRVLGANIPPVVSIAITTVQEDRATPPPPAPGAGDTGAPVIAPPPAPASGGAGDDSETDPGYTAPQ